MAGQIQKALGLKNCFAFDMSAACSGYVYAMNTATALIESGQSKNILIVCSEKLTKDINWKDRGTAIFIWRCSHSFFNNISRRRKRSFGYRYAKRT